MREEVFHLRREQYMLMEDRGRRAFYSLLTLTIVFGYLLYKEAPTIVIPVLSIEVDGIFAILFGPAALILTTMNYHYLNASEHISRERCVNYAQELAFFEGCTTEEIRSIIRRRSIPGKLNLYNTAFKLQHSDQYSYLPSKLWVVSELFWVCVVLIYNCIPFALIGWATWTLLQSDVQAFFRIPLVVAYVILGIGSVFAIPFWFEKIRKDTERMPKADE